MISKLPGEWLGIKINHKISSPNGLIIDCYIRFIGFSAEWFSFSTIDSKADAPYVETQLITGITLPSNIPLSTYDLQFLFQPRVEGMASVTYDMPGELRIATPDALYSVGDWVIHKLHIGDSNYAGRVIEVMWLSGFSVWVYWVDNGESLFQAKESELQIYAEMYK